MAKKRFFESVKHPGLWMNPYGVVFAPRGHEAANTEIYRGVSWDSVPLRSGFLWLRSEIEDEAWEAGYRYRFLKDGEVLWSSPGKMAATP